MTRDGANNSSSTTTNKNNPVLIGEPGVGKTAIEEVAQRIINKGRATMTVDKTMQLDLATLLAGSKFRATSKKG